MASKPAKPAKPSRKPAARRPNAAPDCPRCASTDSLRARHADEQARELETITLTAVVLRAHEPPLFSQAQIAEWTGVHAQSLRNYQRRGMRVYGTHTRPKYHVADVIAWTKYADYLHESKRQKHHITQDEADQWMLAQMQRIDNVGCVLVPIHHDHPSRAYWLRKAAEGRRWTPTEQELLEHYGTDADDLDAPEHDHGDDDV